MAEILPVLTKTYQHSTNILVQGATQLEAYRSLLFGIKEALVDSVTFASACTVVASCNGTTTDVSDLWSDPTDIVWGTGLSAAVAKSWIIFAMPNIAPDFQVGWICEQNSANNTTMTQQIAPRGFDTSSLVTGNLPPPNEAGDIIEVMNAMGTPTSDAYILGNVGIVGGFSARLNVSMSTDGEVIRVFAFESNECRLSWAWEVPKAVQDYWTNPWIAHCFGSNTKVPTYAHFYSEDRIHCRLPDGLTGTDQTMFCTTESANNVPIGQLVARDDYDNSVPGTPMGLCCTTINSRTRGAARFDAFFGAENGEGFHYPDRDIVDPQPIQLVGIGDIILPYPDEQAITS